MLLKSSVLRASQLASRQVRSNIFRNTLQQHFSSTGPTTKLIGPMDNAFNRERLAVKQHAAESTDLWRKLCIYVVIPSLLLATLNAKNLWDEHWEHVSHMPPLEERPQYSYMNIRTKAFPFGDGDKVSDIHGNLILTLNSRSVANVLTLKTLFWNPKVNWKPDP